MIEERRIFLHRVGLDGIQAGMTIGKTIYRIDGVLLLPEGQKLTNAQIAKLKRYHIQEIFIIDDDFSSFIEESPEMHRAFIVAGTSAEKAGVAQTNVLPYNQVMGTARLVEADKAIRQALIHDAMTKEEERTSAKKNEVLKDIKAQIKDIMTSPNLGASIDSKRTNTMIEKLLDQIMTSGDILHHLSNLRSIDDYTFSHCVNVSIYAMIIGIGLNMKTESLHALGAGAIMHDVGKMLVQQDILQKPGGLTSNEFDEIKRHTLLGYELLKKVKNFGEVAAKIALYHHERMDGSGYPLQVKGEEIPLYARIVAVSDVFDALTTNRVYRSKEPPHRALDFITTEAGKHFDADVVDVFVKQMAFYSIGTAVVLSSGEKGLVSRNNPQFPHMPVIRIVTDVNGYRIPQHLECNLFIDRHLKITSIWEL